MAKKSEKIEKTASVRALEDTWTPSYFNGTEKTLFTSEKGVDMNILYSVVKQSPEVMGCIQAITEDIMADEWKFVGKAKKNLEDAKDFAKRVNLYKILTNVIYEFLTTGNSYTLKLSVNAEAIKTLLTQVTKNIAKENNLDFGKRSEILLQDMTKPKDLQIIKSSTVNIQFDETGNVQNYIQKVGSSPARVFKEEDVIHISLANIGGEPYGFTGLEPLLSDVATLIFAKNYAGKFFENDGTPNFLFMMPEDNPDSRNVQALKTELRELKKKDQKFRNIVVTGKVDVKQLMKFDKDMEYSKLIQHFTQIILIGMGVPTHRINYTITDSQSGSQINRAYEGYYKKISFYQRLIENQLNRDLFIPFFKVELKFNRAYKIDEMREAQIAQILAQIGAVTIEEIRDRIGMDPEIPAGTLPIKTGDQNNIDFNADKKREQGQENNPKKPDANIDNKLKSFQNEIDVGFEEFTSIVEKFTGEGGFALAKLLYRETEDSFVLYFNDGSWVYKSIVLKSSIDIEAFKFEKLRNAVRIKY